MRAVIEHLAQTLLDAAGISSHPPIDLPALAAFLGISTVAYRPGLVEHGRLDQTSGQAVITIRSDLSPARQRFTLAHELAHRALAGPHERFIAYRSHEIDSNESEERFCDDLAAALLLPHPWIKQRFASRSENFSTLRHVGHLSGCSLDASVVRLREVLNWNHSLLRFRQNHGAWRFEAGAGVPYDLHGHLRSAPDTSTAFGRRGEHRTDIALLLHGQRLVVPAFVDTNKTTALVLTDLTALCPTTRTRRSSQREADSGSLNHDRDRR